MGSINFATIEPTQEADLFFGPIDGLLVSRTVLDRNEGDRGIISRSNENSEDIRIDIENLTDRAWDLAVFDGGALRRAGGSGDRLDRGPQARPSQRCGPPRYFALGPDGTARLQTERFPSRPRSHGPRDWICADPSNLRKTPPVSSTKSQYWCATTYLYPVWGPAKG